MTLAPDHKTQRRNGAEARQSGDVNLGHVISFSDFCVGGAAVARRSHKPKVVGSNPTPATNFVTNPAPVLPCRPGSCVAETAAGAANGPAAFLSVPLSAFLDAGPCFGPFIDFDDEREFDFSLIPARPKLRLVISNSLPVKA
jgi:hypothetical protein